MNWTKSTPLEGVKYIVRTYTQNLFPAYWENGGWWHSSSATEIFNVCTWIIYPGKYTKNESTGPDIPPEVLLKYAVRDFKRMKEVAKGESEKVTKLKKLNKSLVEEYNALLLAHRELLHKSERKEFIYEAKLEKKRVENRELAEKLSKLRDKLENGSSGRVEKLLKEVERLKEDLKLSRKLARRGHTLHGNLQKMLTQFDMLEAENENQTEEEVVA